MDESSERSSDFRLFTAVIEHPSQTLVGKMDGCKAQSIVQHIGRQHVVRVASPELVANHAVRYDQDLLAR